MLFACLLMSSVRVSAVEDPPGCSLANGGAGNTSQGGINFNLPEAHVGDTVPVFPSLGMANNACKAVNATGAVYIATGLLTNFLVDVTLFPGELVACPANTNCSPGPYNVLIMPAMVGAGVSSPNGGAPGVANAVRAVENGFGTVLTGNLEDQLADIHSASIIIVTPCIQVFKTCDLPSGQGCFSAGMPVRFRGYVTNCGDVTLTNVTVLDDRGAQMSLLDPTNGLSLLPPFALVPGAYAVFSNSFTPTSQETCTGSATSSVTATATDTTRIGGPRASVTNFSIGVCAICVNPAILVTKTCPPGAVAPGGLLTFTGTVTNTGNIPLTNVTVVSDRLLSDGGTLVASFPTLTNGEFRTFSGSYLVPTNVCSITDTLTAIGTPLCGMVAVTNTVTATCAVTNTPRLGLTQNCPATPPAPGQLLLFTGTVTNLGDVAVTNIVIVNDQPTNNTPVTVVTRLEPGEGANYSGSYVMPTNGCSLAGTVTATGFDVCGTMVTTNVTRTCAATYPPPTITCATNKTVEAGTAWTFDPPTANSFNGTNVTITVVTTQTNLVCGDTFTATRTWRATDACDNFSECSQTVTVIDKTLPVITCSSNLVLTADAGQCSRSNVTFFISTTDNCSVTNLVSSTASGSTFPLGTTTVTNTATDASGNTASCIFTVTVTDNQNPLIACPGNLVLPADAGQCSRSNVTFVVNTSDNCSLASLVSSPPSGSTFPLGPTTVTSTVTDGSGNTASCTFTVTVTDNQNSVLLCSSNLVLTADPGQCSRSNVTFFVSASDNCSVTNLVSSTVSGSTFPVGTTTVTTTATDASGNTASCTFTVTVTDNQNPVITCSSNLVLTADAGRCNRSNVTFFVSATDNCSVANLMSSPPSGSTFPPGVTTVTNTATDASGNQSGCSFTVTVTDTQSPEITCPADVTVPANSGCSATNVSLGTPVTSDNCAVASLTNNTPSSAALPDEEPEVPITSISVSGGVVTVTWQSQTGQIYRLLYLDSLSAAEWRVASGDVTATGATTSRTHFAGDAAQQFYRVQLVTSGAPVGFAMGTNFVTWTVTDSSGNTNSCVQRVIVRDSSAPTIICPSNLVLTADAGRCSRSNVTFSVSATDNCSVTNVVSSPPSGSTFPIGTTTVTSTAKDASGNQSSCNFTVTVTDTQNPVITCSSNLVLAADAGRCTRSNVTFIVTATDNCGVTNLVSSPASGSTFPVGVTTVTSTATDASGNQSSCSFTVTVTDNQIPVITCSSNLVLAADAGRCSRSNVTFVVSATDNCSVTNLVRSPPSGSTFPIGTTTVTNTATDASGNQSSCSFTVTVADNQGPVIICPSNLVLVADAGQCSRSNVTFSVSATDNCSMTNLVSTPPSGSTFPVGINTVTNRATDSSGNFNQCTFTVTVLDQQPPVILCPPDITTNVPPGGDAVTNLALGTPVTSDNCGVASVSNNASAIFPSGTNFVLWTVTDNSGNTNSCQQRVVVRKCSGSLSATSLADQTSCPNQPVLFVTTASSPEPIIYLWKFNGQPIAGQTNNSLILANVGPSDSGVYAVEVRTACAAITNSASLTVLTGPSSNPASYTNSVGIVINESGPATPYVSLLPPQCVPAVVKKVTVNIFGFSHRFPSDVSIVLISPDGRQVKLMAGAGGSAELPLPGVNLTFSESATNTLPETDLIVSGTYQPTDHLPGVFLPPPAAGPYSNSLAAFIGADPNGPWILCVFDSSDLDGGSISSWSLDIEWQVPNHALRSSSLLSDGGRESNLSLQNSTMLPNGAFRVEVFGQTGVPIIIESSSDLTTWLPLATNVYTTNPGVFIDPSPPYPSRFYRAVQP